MMTVTDDGAAPAWWAAVGRPQEEALYTQECLHCRSTIYRGEGIVCGAVNLFNLQPVWMHPGCAAWYTESFGPRLVVDDGWRIATASQQCMDCHQGVRPGDKIYRAWTWPLASSVSPYLRYVCHWCWRKDHGATAEPLAP